MSQEIMAFVEDIFLTAKIREVARAQDAEVRFVRDLTGLEKRFAGPVPGAILVDLTADALKPLELIPQIQQVPEWAGVRILAFASHARAELIEEASRLGVETVSKTDFLARLPEYLQTSAV